MPALQRQRNTGPSVAMVPEVRGPDGAVFAARDVDPGGEIDFPVRLTGFTGWVAPEPTPAPATAPDEAKPVKKAAAPAPAEGK